MRVIVMARAGVAIRVHATLAATRRGMEAVHRVGAI